MDNNQNSDQSKIRNFSIIAHIDHGKSTLADRLLEACGKSLAREKIQDRIMDRLEIEQLNFRRHVYIGKAISLI